MRLRQPLGRVRTNPSSVDHCAGPFHTSPVLAQNATVSGVVIDDRTERPIKGMLVYIEGQQTLVEYSRPTSLRQEQRASRTR